MSIQERHERIYLAGAMDCDGSFGIKQHSYAMRVTKDATQPIYSERASLKQVTPQIPHLLQKHFGGCIHLQKPQSIGGRFLWSWLASDRVAYNCAQALLPFLILKKRHAELLIELRHTKETHKYKKISYWFEKEYPEWQKMPLLTFAETAKRLGYVNYNTVGISIANGSLLALPRSSWKQEIFRIPEALVDRLAPITKASKMGRPRPPELMAWRFKLWKEIKALNTVGSGIVPNDLNNRTGRFTPKATFKANGEPLP